MNIIAVNKSDLSAMLTYHELLIVSQALNEVCNGLRMPDFSKTIGVERAEANQLHRSLIAVRDTHDAEVSITFAYGELRILSKALEEVHDRLSPFEFATRMGAQRTETDHLLADILDALTAHPGADNTLLDA
jgi:hypothetical protein